MCKTSNDKIIEMYSVSKTDKNYEEKWRMKKSFIKRRGLFKKDQSEKEQSIKCLYLSNIIC